MAKKKSSGKVSAKTTKVAAKKSDAKASAAVVEPAIEQVVVAEQPVRLQMWNVVLAALFGVQALGVLLLAGGTKSFQVMAGFLAQDPLQTAAQGQAVWVFAVHHLFDVNLAWLVTAALLVMAVSHALLATGRRLTYEAAITQGINPTRWHAYALAGGLAGVAVALLSGVQDLGLLAALFGLLVVMPLCYQITERSKPASKLSLAVGKGAGALAWLVVGYYLLAGVLYGSALPTLVYVTFGVAAASFVALSVLVWLASRGKGRFANTIFTEQAYMVLSLVGLSTVAWLSVVSTLK